MPEITMSANTIEALKELSQTGRSTRVHIKQLFGNYEEINYKIGLEGGHSIVAWRCGQRGRKFTGAIAISHSSGTFRNTVFERQNLRDTIKTCAATILRLTGNN